MSSQLIIELCKDQKKKDVGGPFWNIFYKELVDTMDNKKVNIVRSSSSDDQICKKHDVDYIIVVPGKIEILVSLSEALIKSYTKFAEKLSHSFGINLDEIAKAYKKGLKNLDTQNASSVSNAMNRIKASIGRAMIIVNPDERHNKSKITYNVSRLIWKNIGLCFTDAKTRRWLKGYVIEFGTTDSYSAGAYLRHIKITLLHTDYIRLVRDKPRVPLIFEHKRDIATIISKEFVNALITSIDISRKIYKTATDLAKDRNIHSENPVKIDYKYIQELINELSSKLRGQELIPRTPDETYAFLSSIISYDGSIHGNLLILNRKLHSMKGLIMDSLIRLIEKNSNGVIKTYKTRKYAMELPIFIGFQGIKHIVNEIDHPIKKRKIFRILKRYNGLNRLVLKIRSSDITTLSSCISGYKLIRWRDTKYPKAHGYKVVILIDSRDNCVIVLNDICKRLDLYIDLLPRSKVFKISGKKALIIALLSIVKEELPVDLIPKYSSKTYLWRLLDEIKTIITILKAHHVIEDKLYHKIMLEIDKLMRL